MSQKIFKPNELQFSWRITKKSGTVGADELNVVRAVELYNDLGRKKFFDETQTEPVAGCLVLEKYFLGQTRVRRFFNLLSG